MMGGGGGWFVPVLIAVLIGVAVALAVSGGTGGRDREHAHEILRRRLAAGEIDVEEYRERAESLDQDRAGRASLRRWLPAFFGILALLLLIGLLVLGTGRPGEGWWGPMGGPMGGMGGQRTDQDAAPAAVPDAEELTVEMTEMAFEPATLEVTAGEPVNLTVANVGQAFHDLTIDELDLQLGVEPGETVTAGLEADEPGEYRYYCSVPGHASAGMEGTLTVSAP
ncbi:MAG: cupredoxin domain-containing protein [Nitriliruptoraceae bacterium]